MDNRPLDWLAAGIAVTSIATAVADDVLGFARGSSVKVSSLSNRTDRLETLGGERRWLLVPDQAPG
jgi:hypothetical protein